jgi:serpin B
MVVSKGVVSSFVVVLTIAVVLLPPPLRTQTAAGIVPLSGQVFATRLFAKLPHDTNLFFSPASLRMALGMALAGARDGTAIEMMNALALNGDARTTPNGFAEEVRALADARQPQEVIRVVNRVWGQRGRAFKPDYLALLQRRYGAPLGQLDFKKDTENSRIAINKFVEEKTERRIKEIIPSGMLSPDMRLVITNAVYFRANWAIPFLEEATREDWFHISASKAVRAKLMSTTQWLGYATVGDAQVLEVRYAGRMSMIIALPRGKNGLAQVERTMNDKTIASWVNALKMTRVKLTLPRFTMTSSYKLRTILESMGIRSAFDWRTADFSGIDGTRELSLDQVLHKAFVAVDERGTEAAAATALGMRIGGLAPPPTPPVEFRADHPFVFIVQDVNAGSVLFMGRVVEPTGPTPG